MRGRSGMRGSSLVGARSRMPAHSSGNTCKRRTHKHSLAKDYQKGARKSRGRTPFGNRADDLTIELNVDPDTPSSAEPRSGLLRNPAFIVILIATSLSSVGLAMFETG